MITYEQISGAVSAIESVNGALKSSKVFKKIIREDGEIVNIFANFKSFYECQFINSFNCDLAALRLMASHDEEDFGISNYYFFYDFGCRSYISGFIKTFIHVFRHRNDLPLISRIRLANIKAKTLTMRYLQDMNLEVFFKETDEINEKIKRLFKEKKIKKVYLVYIHKQ